MSLTKLCVISCNRCGGRGVIPRFGHTLKGRCFKCDGAKVVAVGLLAARRRVGMRGANARREVPSFLALVPLAKVQGGGA